MGRRVLKTGGIQRSIGQTLSMILKQRGQGNSEMEHLDWLVAKNLWTVLVRNSSQRREEKWNLKENVKGTHLEDRTELTNETVLETILSGLFCE